MRDLRTSKQLEVLSDLNVVGLDDFYDQLQKRVSEFTLENGLHFIVLERHVAPVVSCHIYADVGAFDEPNGQTGDDPCLLKRSLGGTIPALLQDSQRSTSQLFVGVVYRRHCALAGAHGFQRLHQNRHQELQGGGGDFGPAGRRCASHLPNHASVSQTPLAVVQQDGPLSH